MKLILQIAVLAAAFSAPLNAEEIIRGACRTEDHIIVFAKHFDIDGKTQKPIGDTGRCIVLKKGQSYKGWKLDQERWRWHCGTGRNKWTGPVGEEIRNLTGIPGVGALFHGIFGNWERDRSRGAKSIDIEYRKDGTIVFTAHH